jgi:hypothetical protein
MRKFIGSSLCLLLFLATTTLLNANTVSFVPASSGSLGTSSKSYGPITATAFYWNGSAWVTGVTNLSLYGRNETNDAGIGVCDPNEFSPTNLCGTGGGNGDWNELSNEISKELIRLQLAAGNSWVSVQLSSLDGNSTGTLDDERGTLWASNSGAFDGSAVKVCNFVAFGSAGTCFGTTTNIEPTINISNSYSNYTYLYFQPNDWTGGGNTNNDFLIRGATVPEPSSLILFGFGVAGLLTKRRLRK